MIAGDQILKPLKPTHSRLIVDADSLARVKGLVRAHPHAQRWYAYIRSEADEILGLPPSEYEIPDGRRLLSVSWRVKERARTLGFVFLLEGDERYRDLLWAEAEAAAAFQGVTALELQGRITPDWGA